MVSQEDAAYIRQLFPEVGEIGNAELADKVVEIWVETWHASEWDKIEDAPKNPENVGDRKLIPHVRAVTREAVDVARSIEEFHGINVDMDLLIAGSLLHDVSKLVEYGPKNGSAGKTTVGKLVQHGVYGAAKVIEKGLPPELTHMVVSHTTGSNKPPSTLECAILHYVDYADFDALLHAAGQKLLLAKGH